MKILLDECVVQEFRTRLKGHDVFTVTYVGWSGIKNGKLLALAAADGFEAFVTTDQKIEHQQNLQKLPLAVVILHAASNDLDDLEPLVPQSLGTLHQVKAKSLFHVHRNPAP